MAMRKNPALKIAQKTARKAVFDPQGNPKPGVHNMILRAVEIQRPWCSPISAGCSAGTPGPLRPSWPTGSNATTWPPSRAAARWGRAGVIQGVGTVAALRLSAVATVALLEGPPYATSLAELPQRLVDPEKASALVMAVVLGEEGTALLGSLSGQAAGRGEGLPDAWGSAFARGRPGVRFRETASREILRSLLRRRRRGAPGRALPFGVGAVVGGGGVGNRVMGRAVVANAKEAFGPIQDTIPGELADGAGPASAPGAGPGPATPGDHSAGAQSPETGTTKGGSIGSER